LIEISQSNSPIIFYQHLFKKIFLHMYKKSAILILLFGTVSKMLNAQTISAADTLAKSNKLYAVVTVLAVILVGIFIYLFSLERKIKKLEKEISSNKK